MRVAKLAAVLILVSLFGGQPQPYTADYFESPWPALDLSDDEAAAIESINSALRAQGSPGLTTDPRVVLVCRDICGLMEENGVESIDGMTTDDLNKRLRRAGITDARFMINMGNAGRTDEFVGSVTAQVVRDVRSANFTHIGIGVVRDLWPPQNYVTLILTKRLVQVGTFPREVKEGARQILSAAPEPAARNVQVHLTDPRGVPVYVKTSTGDRGKIFAELEFKSGPGIYTVEVTFEGKYGPEVASLFQVACTGADGGVPQQGDNISPRAEIDWDISTEDEAEDLILMLINDERISSGLPPLALYPPLSGIAREHSRDMALNNFVGHISPRTGDVADRADRAGIRWRKLAENIARAGSIKEAHRGLMGSPVHRQNVLDPEVQFVGVGVAFVNDPYGKRDFIITVDFMSMR